jgi:hypothetical protein
MSKQRPEPYSPLLDLVRRVGLWSLVPVALAAVWFYLNPPVSPFSPAGRREAQEAERRMLQDYDQRRRNAFDTADDIVRKSQGGSK